MHTLPAAKVVSHDFLGNHIGELLFRQPASRPPPPSSNGSSMTTSDSKTVRKGSTTSHHTPALTSARSTSTDAQHASSTIHDRSSLGAGATTTFGVSGDPVASLQHSNESSPSEPSSVDSRYNSADADLNLLHLSQLDLSRKRNASEGGSSSPRVTFVTSFGAKQRRSGSRCAPSEAGSSSYFGLSSNISSASMSPMEPSSGAINWNVPFREQHNSFAKAIEHNPLINRKPSPSSQASEASSWQLPPPSASQPNPVADIVTPTASTGSGVGSVKSQSFSGMGSSAPVSQRISRAATESTLDSVAQKQAQGPALASPNGPSEHSSKGMAHSKSMDSTTSGVRGHHRKPSLVQKGDDGRTFCFVNEGGSDAGSHPVLTEEPEGADATLTSVPEVAAPAATTATAKPMSKSSSQSSYREVVEEQYRAKRRTSRARTNGDDGASHPSIATALFDKITSTASSITQAAALEATEIRSTPTQQAHAVVRGQDTLPASANVLTLASSLRPSGSSRPMRRLRIQPNVQSRPSLLERTMQQQHKASQVAIASNANGGVDGEGGATVASALVSSPVADEKPAQTPGLTPAAAANQERYGPVAYGAESRTFRIHPSTPATENNDVAFAGLPGGTCAPNTSNRTEPASHARTSDWARAQNLFADSQQPAQSSDGEHSDLEASCASLLTLDGSSGAAAAVEHGRPAAQSLMSHHTASYSSESTDSPSLLDNREMLSPPETAISTPELESPPEHALLNGDDDAGPFKLTPRRPSPLSS
ncbi:hypothetical protein EX895_000515 [Sporisorium graminicola]|uniref:Uncharacterized protein n=1 Tax=Sporisorium graminicola TaxID=280036 RepID=A0A4U7L1E6_9BASI|nr:hypothetical protein EX895_000515 [Sporisorium graminicola]TKY90517.1 hypothetical protein EX895_000515 [Sporisorium graminicola]